MNEMVTLLQLFETDRNKVLRRRYAEIEQELERLKANEDNWSPEQEDRYYQTLALYNRVKKEIEKL